MPFGDAQPDHTEPGPFQGDSATIPFGPSPTPLPVVLRLSCPPTLDEVVDLREVDPEFTVVQWPYVPRQGGSSGSAAVISGARSSDWRGHIDTSEGR